MVFNQNDMESGAFNDNLNPYEDPNWWNENGHAEVENYGQPSDVMYALLDAQDKIGDTGQ